MKKSQWERYKNTIMNMDPDNQPKLAEILIE